MEAISKINDFARNVMWRKRLLALQDALAFGLCIGGFIAAALIFYIRWKALQTPVWIVALAVFSCVFGALLTRWSISRTDEQEAGFLIDEKLNLEDRFTTAQALIAKGKVVNEVEQALLEDASSRIADAKATTIAPYRMQKYYALSAIALLVLGFAVMIPQKALPGGEEVMQAQADIQAAGDQLEKTSTEIEKFVPPDTVTANLAKEQAELGRSLRRSTDTRAEALKKLSSLEERIRARHDELKSTRADEIVALAQRRLGSTLSQMSNRNLQSSANEKQQASEVDAADGSSNKDKASGKQATGEQTSTDNADKNLEASKVDGKNRQAEKSPKNKDKQSADKKSPVDSTKQNSTVQAATNQSAAEQTEGKQKSQATTKQNSTEQKNSGENSAQNQIAEKQKSKAEKDPIAQKSGQRETQNTKGDANQKANAKNNSSSEKTESDKNIVASDNPAQGKDEEEANKSQQNQAENQAQGQNKDSANPLTTALAEQTTKALSEQLLKKAEDLKAGKMSAEDMKKLAQSATQLAKDLAPIAQSKEFQQTLEQLAKQVNPQQLEQVARALMQDEKLQRELKAAAKLLWENRQVKDMVAGLTKTGAELEAEMRQKRGEDKGNQPPENLPNPTSEPIAINSKGNAKGQQSGTPGQATQTARVEKERKLAGQGKEARINGQLQNRAGGDYVFSGVKPGAGAVRVPYSSAYPQYRRQAERTVERSQVPTQMRSMIRSYFDAINPNGKN